MTHPGKKLLFMGQDIGEFDEWNENRRVQWELRDVPEHECIASLVKDLNHLYRTNKAMYELDGSPDGFEWINNISANDCYLTSARKASKPEDVLLIVANFSGVEKEITTGVPFDGKYKEILNTDDKKYGGSGIVNARIKSAQDREWDDRKQSITVKMAPLSISILQFVPFTEEELEKVIAQRIRKSVPVKTVKKKTIMKAEEKPVRKSVKKPEVKQEKKTEVKLETKPEKKPKVKPVQKTVKKSGSKPGKK